MAVGSRIFKCILQVYKIQMIETDHNYVKFAKNTVDHATNISNKTQQPECKLY
jgi:hypothetical protein